MRPARTIRIRTYRAGDAPALRSLVRGLAAFGKLPAPTFDAERRLIRDVGSRFEALFAEIGGRVVGAALYFLTYSTFLARPTLFVEDLFVVPEFRRHGIGRRLLHALIAEGRRLKCGRMEWVVLSWNRPAHLFYRTIARAQVMKEWVPYRLVLRRDAF